MASNIAIRGSGVANMAGPAARPPQVRKPVQLLSATCRPLRCLLYAALTAQEAGGPPASSALDQSAADEAPVAAVLDSQGIGRRLPPARQVSEAQSAHPSCRCYRLVGDTKYGDGCLQAGRERPAQSSLWSRFLALGGQKRRGAVASHPSPLPSREPSSAGLQAGADPAPEDQAWFNAAFTSSALTSFSLHLQLTPRDRAGK